LASSAFLILLSVVEGRRARGNRPPMSNQQVLDWIIAARDGSKVALDELLDHYRPMLLAIAREEIPSQLVAKVGPSTIAQQSCMDVARGIVTLRATSEAECRTWLREIVKSNVADAARRFLGTEKRDIRREVSLTGGKSHPLIRAIVSTQLAPDAEAILHEDHERLQAALLRLPNDYRQVIEMHHRQQLSFVDIAVSLGKSPDAVRMTYNRAIKKLAQELSRDIRE
jgi:RNA polymerase sigma-70 factor, ECF subfamily